MATDLSTILGPLAGHEIPGGCDTCAAVQTVQRDEQLAGIWHLVVRHAEGCPTYEARS